jgi:hypothetical protein
MANIKSLRTGFTNSLRTGFTGELDETGSVTAKAKQAVGYVRDEAGAVARSAADHPSATTTALLIFGATAFVAGYLIGSASGAAPTRRSYW